MQAQKFQNPLTNYKVVTTNETFITDTTVFKLITWFIRKPSGVPYSIIEKQYNKNRKYIESYDYIFTEDNKTITRHDLGLDKLRKFYNDHRDNISTAWLMYNDFTHKKQYKLGEYYLNAGRNTTSSKAIFHDPDELGNVFIKELAGNPLGTYELINRTIEYTKQISNRILLK